MKKRISEAWIFVLCVFLFVSFSVACSSFHLKVGELKDAEVSMTTGEYLPAEKE